MLKFTLCLREWEAKGKLDLRAVSRKAIGSGSSPILAACFRNPLYQYCCACRLTDFSQKRFCNFPLMLAY